MSIQRCAAACLALAACAFDLPLPEPPVGGAGMRCRTGQDCASGVCGDGICCGHACGARETCASPEAPGVCVARVLGDPCSVDQGCPTGFCVDGACCEARCEGACVTCAREGSRGK